MSRRFKNRIIHLALLLAMPVAAEAAGIQDKSSPNSSAHQSNLPLTAAPSDSNDLFSSIDLPGQVRIHSGVPLIKREADSPHNWHPPTLTPELVASIKRKREHEQAMALAKRMADRAFYFGIDTNNDALE